MSGVQFREIHKNSWLRKLPAGIDKKSALKLTGGQKLWTVFCIHDDTEPVLEFYVDQKKAAAHRPDNAVPLSDTVHVSATICPLPVMAGDHQQQYPYEFVITLTSDVVRLAAPSWNQMMDWVQGLDLKLREMHILSPKENVYTKPPESRPPLLPTRDPNSPLPPPPLRDLSTNVLPGVEPVVSVVQSIGTEDSLSSEIEQTFLTPPISPNPISPSEPVNNVTIVEVINHNQVFNFNQMEQVLNQTNEQPSQTSSEPLINSPRPSRSSSSTSENVAASPRQSSRHHQVRNASILEESVSGARSSSHSEFSDRTTHVDNMPQRSTSEVPNEGQRIKVRIAEPEDGRHRRRPKRQDVIPPTTDQEVTSNYEHLILPTAMQSRPPPALSNSIPADIAILPTRSQLPIGRGRGARRKVNGDSSHPALGADRIRVAVNSSTHNMLQPVPTPFTPTENRDLFSPSRLTVREKQVLQLRKEMSHLAGVRLQLRRKDCINTIALVDVFQTVWIAGWKQKEHPMLHNALHLGDQLLSVAGKPVSCSTDAHKLIRAWPSLYVELIIRRVPCGRVFVVRRQEQGQDLGIIQEGGTAEIKDILPNSLAAAHGLSSRTPTLDGLSFTSWTLTEINSRPLNLLFKETEVRDRLNAVGLDISLLVQPTDLISALRKQLKSLKSFKDFLLI
ncbi:uncharacterized protein LOC100165690 isoform X1 [Acyrthosiphon pisum]|uniref:PH domain-containing protein n=1 Tax=Acyrthosiphon pisum TaxID=7029 RepID=A0A8R1W7W9_ACYPI|nr:uncharacterized protein LOC100165690 isoform X1 [Acyrthosiphon pisum]XP_016659895.1 uncharacterized protein LOC100165690 isoform X1 [Acyrthosiphon pisum]XP_016659896.1 uncharacterized protein LOC100165690 isoform X1 [Acyrthosiphon pisum]|eukprot:XP_001950315.2 PREDICTED: uncharacterized protein LOC100165690 isoform X1 [Acyrthosiphon pisum]